MKKVYYLKEKGSAKPKYIGMTNQPLKLRLENHNSDFRGDTKKTTWIKKCKEQNIKIEIILIGEYEKNKAKEMEIFYINKYRSEGVDLVNEKVGVLHTEKFKQEARQRRLGHHHSAEVLLKMKQSQIKYFRKVSIGSVVYESINDASNKTGISAGLISSVCNGKRNSKKYKIKFV